MNKQPQTEWERFSEATKKILSVSKTEVDAAIKAEQAKRKALRKAR
jgi:hypothetical protein